MIFQIQKEKLVFEFGMATASRLHCTSQYLSTTLTYAFSILQCYLPIHDYTMYAAGCLLGIGKGGLIADGGGVEDDQISVVT